MILFDARSVSLASPIFFVRPGTGVMLSAFGLMESQQAVIEKVRYEDSIMPQGGACEDLEPPMAVVMQAEDVTQGGVWQLNACQNLAVLTVPGSYRLNLNDEAALGLVYIEAIGLDGQAAALIPPSLFFGACGGCDCGG
ncbi:hypothetical protein [Paraburkholderia dinghuensis]|uniref:Uncharacterized protein n=1 Tax=Paraburkholderia dinghuensis TaxID=2305225 RepID=A0A3N6MRN9_9BURK|nr:hypothetical protein [Paraburkholderia dinghuensis]RQH06634.1 hypothetical protein D1Y85_12235 [Paraburkholderia dinghuensis]